MTFELSNFWLEVSVIAIMISISVVALLYMVGMAISNRRIISIAKSEFLQAMASILIVAFMGIMVATFTEVDGVTGVSIDTQFQKLKDHFQSRIDTLEGIYNSYYSRNLAIAPQEYECTTRFGITDCKDGLVTHPYVESYRTMGYKALQLQVAYHSEKVLVEYIHRSALAVFLPLGIILRIIPLTRGLGGLLMALAIGFYIIFPIFFFASSLALSVSTTSIDYPPAVEIQQCSSDTISQTTAVTQAYQLQFQEMDTQVEQTYAALSIDLMFTPFVALAVTLFFVRFLASIFGGDSALILRGVSKMV